MNAIQNFNTYDLIKLGDYVYIPHYSRKALKVFESFIENRPLRAFVNDDAFIDFHENGLSSRYHIEPIAFLATLKNKAKIEKFYGCKLENPPKQQNKNDNNGWVSVDDRLPTDTGYYLVYDDKNTVEKIVIDTFFTQMGAWVNYYPTHWQPLPQPPKEQ